MSEYVESRYARMVLQEARVAQEEVASRLVNELLPALLVEISLLALMMT